MPSQNAHSKPSVIRHRIKNNHTSIIVCILISSFFIFSTYTWSYIGTVGGLLIRPYDLVAIALTLFCVITKPLPLPSVIVVLFALFILLALYFISYGLVTSNSTPLASGLKILFLYVSSYAVAILLNAYHERLQISYIVSTFSTILVVALVFNPSIIDKILSVFYARSISDISSVVFDLWRTIFETNLFDSSSSITVRGISFRNSAALGIFSIFLFSTGFVKPSLTKTLFNTALVVLCFITYSRTGWALLSAYFLTSMILRRDRLSVITFVGMAITILFFLLPGVYESVLEDRIQSRFGRFEQYVDGFRLLVEKPLFGHGSGTKIYYSSDGMTLHNVYIAIGVDYGVVAMALALTINLFTIALMFRYFQMLRRARSPEAKQLHLSRAMASLAVSAVPHISASAENMFSIGGWACFAIMLSGLFKRRPNSEIQ